MGLGLWSSIDFTSLLGPLGLGLWLWAAFPPKCFNLPWTRSGGSPLFGGHMLASFGHHVPAPPHRPPPPPKPAPAHFPCFPPPRCLTPQPSF